MAKSLFGILIANNIDRFSGNVVHFNRHSVGLSRKCGSHVRVQTDSFIHALWDLGTIKSENSYLDFKYTPKNTDFKVLHELLKKRTITNLQTVNLYHIITHRSYFKSSVF